MWPLVATATRGHMTSQEQNKKYQNVSNGSAWDISFLPRFGTYKTRVEDMKAQKLF